MRKDGLGKLYDRLTPEERFRLVIEAEIREDERELRWLVDSAPRYTYTQADLAFREELGLEPKKLVKFWFQAALSEIEELEALTEDVELDREKMEESEAYIRDGWRKLLEG